MNKSILLGLATILTIFLSLDVEAISGPKILEVSLSKKSIILDRGELEGIQNGVHAKIYFQDVSEGILHPKMIFIGDAEAIKVHSNYSYWFLKNIEEYDLLKRGRKVLLIRQDEMQRRSFRTRKTKYVTSVDKSVGQLLDDQKTAIPKDLIQDADNYSHSKPIVENSLKSDSDIHIKEYEKSQVSKSKEWDDDYLAEFERTHSAPINSDEKNLVKKNAEKEVFDSTTFGVERKMNSQKYGLVGLYQDSERQEDNTSLKREQSLESSYMKAKEDNKRETFISPYALNKIKSGGPLWSSDMDDQQLRRFFIQSGISREIKRQKRVLQESPAHEINIKYSNGVGTHTTASDVNHQNVDYALGISYEFHLSNTIESFKNLTLEIELERGISHFDLGGINGRFVEGSFRGYGHWYFWNSPESVGKYMPYLGIGIRRGTADMESFSLTQNYEYQILSLPSYRFGVKYRFKAGDSKEEIVKLGFGVNFGLTIEPTRYSAVNQVVENIEPVIEANLIRLGVGLNVYF